LRVVFLAADATKVEDVPDRGACAGLLRAGKNVTAASIANAVTINAM